MSNIWHTTKEKPMLHTDIILCGDEWSMAIDIIPETVNTICCENVEKWCYLDELILENERTRKALDIAADALKRTDWCAQDYAIAQEALDKITALEQKDVK